jgi:hypothetical protein
METKLEDFIIKRSNIPKQFIEPKPKKKFIIKKVKHHIIEI